MTYSIRTVTNYLNSLAPRFLLLKGDIEILESPITFYKTLLFKISNSKHRIFLSSLYIGKTQHELIQCIDDAMAKNADLKVYVLTDALRGTREAPDNCSALLLASLQKIWPTN